MGVAGRHDRAGTLCLGGDRAASRRHLRVGRRHEAARRPAAAVERSRIAISLLFMAGVVALLWWRGPSFTAIGDAFTTVRLEVGRRRDRAQPRVRRRARDRMADGDQSGDGQAAPRQPARLLGLLGRALRERGAARPDRRARARRRADAQAPRRARHVGDARRHRLRAPRLRPRARADPDPLRRAHCEDPGLGDHEPDRLRRGRCRPLHVRVRERAAAEHVDARRRRCRPQDRGDGATGARRDALARRRDVRGPPADLGLGLSALRGVGCDARVRHSRAAAGRGRRPAC